MFSLVVTLWQTTSRDCGSLSSRVLTMGSGGAVRCGVVRCGAVSVRCGGAVVWYRLRWWYAALLWTSDAVWVKCGALVRGAVLLRFFNVTLNRICADLISIILKCESHHCLTTFEGLTSLCHTVSSMDTPDRQAGSHGNRA